MVIFQHRDSGPSRQTSAPAQKRTRRTVTGIHVLVQGAKQLYERGYKVEEGQLLRPYKRQLVDVTASAAGLDKALAFANDLFKALESAGHRVRFAYANVLLCIARTSMSMGSDSRKLTKQEKSLQSRFAGSLPAPRLFTLGPFLSDWP